MSKGIHDGHRARMKEQFLQNGIDAFNEHQVLEMLLFFSVSRKDTNPLAHRLIERFGGLAEVLDADYEELLQVDGVTEHVATSLVFSRALAQRYSREKVRDCTMFSSLDDIGRYLQAQFLGEKCEKLRILCLNNRGKLLNCSVISEGTVNATTINTRTIVQTALRYPTTIVVMAHNHPAGFALPSPDDLRSTITVKQALELVDIHLVDHLIFSQNDYVSISQTNRFSEVFSTGLRDESLPDWLK